MSNQIKTLPQFSPPGHLTDFDNDTAKVWSDRFISYWMTGEIKAEPGVVIPGRTPLDQFFNGTVTPYDQSQDGSSATWNAFPQLVTTAFKTAPLKWQVADAQRMFQDEYLEWSIARDSDKNIKSVTYTCEGPEYWSVFASYQRDDFFRTVKELNPDFASEMTIDDFFLVDPKTGNTVYDPNNRWNVWSKTGSIIHLCQPNNTLSAEIDIAAQATVIRKNAKADPISDPNVLINCSQYGNAGRNSDPTIGGTINMVARGGDSISVKDPVALYINSFDSSNFSLDISGNTSDKPSPKDEDLIPVPDGTFTFVRGDISQSQGLRLRVRLPDTTPIGKNGKPLTVSSIWDSKTNHHIKYGAQIAEYVTMGVTAVTIPKGEPAPSIPCFGEEKKKREAKSKGAAPSEVEVFHNNAKSAPNTEPKRHGPPLSRRFAI